MTVVSLVASGWIVAAVSAAVAVSGGRRLARRMEQVARASHELRGPLTAATLGLQLENMTPRRRAIELELGRAALALEDLTAIGSTLGQDRELELVDMQRLLADSVEAWRPAAAARGIQMGIRRSDGPATVVGDRLRLAQATGNLIANAIEHGAEGVEVRVRAEATEVRVEVADRGPGLSSPVAELARKRRRGPRGRGLAIASEIVRAHGGRLAAAPSERGARLVVSLPAAAAIGEPTRGSGA